MLSNLNSTAFNLIDRVYQPRRPRVSDVDDIANGIGKVDVSDKEAVISSAIKQAEVAEKEDQNRRVFIAQSLQLEIVTTLSR